MTEVQTTNNGTKSVDKPKRQRKVPPQLPSMASASDMADITFICKVDVSPIAWDALPLNATFSLSPDGSYPKVKVHRTKACDLRTGDSIPAGGGRCYRVFF